MDTHDRHEAVDYARMVMAVAAVLFAIAFTVLVVWIITAEPKTKLYEADGYVCASQPFATQCFERKAR